MSSPFPKPEKYNYKYFRFLIWLSYRGRGNNHQTSKSINKIVKLMIVGLHLDLNENREMKQLPNFSLSARLG